MFIIHSADYYSRSFPMCRMLVSLDYASKYATVLNTMNLIFSLCQKMWATLSKSAIFWGSFLVKTAFLLEEFEVEVVGINRLKG